MYNSLLTFGKNNLENCILFYIYRIQLSDTSSNKIRSICSSWVGKWLYVYVGFQHATKHSEKSLMTCLYISPFTLHDVLLQWPLAHNSTRTLVFTDAWTTLYKNGGEKNLKWSKLIQQFLSCYFLQMKTKTYCKIVVKSTPFSRFFKMFLFLGLGLLLNLSADLLLPLNPVRTWQQCRS